MDPAIMAGKPCIRGMRVTVGMILGNLAEGLGVDEIVAAYPYVEREDVLAALEFAWLRVQEADLPVGA